MHYRNPTVQNLILMKVVLNTPGVLAEGVCLSLGVYIEYFILLS